MLLRHCGFFSATSTITCAKADAWRPITTFPPSLMMPREEHLEGKRGPETLAIVVVRRI